MSDVIPGYLSTREAADLLGVDVSQVARLVKSDRIHGIKIGRDWIVSRESVEEYFKTKSPKGQPSSHPPKILTETK